MFTFYFLQNQLRFRKKIGLKSSNWIAYNIEVSKNRNPFSIKYVFLSQMQLAYLAWSEEILFCHFKGQFTLFSLQVFIKIVVQDVVCMVQSIYGLHKGGMMSEDTGISNSPKKYIPNYYPKLVHLVHTWHWYVECNFWHFLLLQI